MRTFKDIISELAEPKARREKAFKDKHVVQKIDHPVADEGQFTAKKTKKDKTKHASMHDGEDATVYEETMSDAEKKKREDIVMGMKKSKADLKKRYGDRWKSVMYATATKNAMKESSDDTRMGHEYQSLNKKHVYRESVEEVELDEAFKAGSMKLNDGSSVKVTSEQASSLNTLFKELNSSNKKKMEERLMSSSKGFNEILSFAKEAL